MKNKIFAFIVSLTIVCIYSCSGSKITNTDIETSQWILDTLNGNKVILIRGITLVFDKEKSKISGFGGCNSYFGNYVNNGEKLLFSEIGSTKMACDSMEPETAYFSALSKIDKFKISSKTLYLYSSGSQVMVFKKIE